MLVTVGLGTLACSPARTVFPGGVQGTRHVGAALGTSGLQRAGKGSSG